MFIVMSWCDNVHLKTDLEVGVSEELIIRLGSRPIIIILLSVTSKMLLLGQTFVKENKYFPIYVVVQAVNVWMIYRYVLMTLISYYVNTLLPTLFTL